MHCRQAPRLQQRLAPQADRADAFLECGILAHGFLRLRCGECGLVMTFAAWKGGGRLVAADGWLLLAVLSTSIAYVAGARVSGGIPAQQVICWVVVGSLPFTLPATLW